jgi:hypothetical protein
LTFAREPAIILASSRCLPGASESFGRRGREVEGTPLLREHLGQNLDRGFESLRLRQLSLIFGGETPQVLGLAGFLFFIAGSDCYTNHVGVTRGLVENRMSTHLTGRGSVYYLRRRIPNDLVDGFGKHEVVRSLRGKGRAEDARLLRRASVDLDEQFALMRAGTSGRSTDPDQAANAACVRDISLVPTDPALSMSADGQQIHRQLVLLPRSKVTLDSLIPSWEREGSPTAKTVAEVERVVRDASELDVRSITRQTIIGFRDKWLNSGASIATVNKKIGCLRLLLGVAKECGLIDTNPAEGAELPMTTRAVERGQSQQSSPARNCLRGLRFSDYSKEHLAMRALP